MASLLPLFDATLGWQIKVGKSDWWMKVRQISPVYAHSQ